MTLVRGWHIASSIQKPGAFSAQDILDRKDELFGDNPREPVFM